MQDNLSKPSSHSVNKNQIDDHGIGLPVEGSQLKKVTSAILSRLDFELDEEPHKTRQDMELSMP